VRALIVNRLHPRFDARPDGYPLGVLGQESDRGESGVRAHEAYLALAANWADLRAEAEHEENFVAPLAARVAPAPVVRVPLFAHDVHDLVAVQTLADCLAESLAEGGGGHRIDSAYAVPPKADTDIWERGALRDTADRLQPEPVQGSASRAHVRRTLH
jgi:hypothetical protein